MTQEEKQILFKDLCARLPYKVFITIMADNGDMMTDIIRPYTLDIFNNRNEIKPYLRSMSSMTEEEKEEFEKISHCFLKIIVLKRDKKCRIVEQKVYIDNETPSSGAFGDNGDYKYIKQEYFTNLIDWFNAHHFDFRGLIEKGLALEAPENMYKN